MITGQRDEFSDRRRIRYSGARAARRPNRWRHPWCLDAIRCTLR